MKKSLTVVFGILFLYTGNIFSQDKLSKGLNDSKNISDMLSVNIGGPVLNKLTIHSEGEPMLKAKNTIAPLIEIEYYKSIYKSFGLKTGTGFNFVPFNTNFSFSVDRENGISGDFYESQYEYNIVNFNIYLLISKFFRINDKFSTSVEMGIKYNYISKNSLPISIGYSYYNQVGDTSLHFLSFMIYHNKDCFSFMGNVNFLYHISRKSTLIAGLTFNYSPVYVANGYYSFENLPWESYGIVELGIDYLGLKIGYGYSF